MLQEYSELAKRALEALIPFPTTYLCEVAISPLVNINTTYRNRVRISNVMRIALSNIKLILMSLFRRAIVEVTLPIICADLCRVNSDIPLATCVMLS